MLLVYLAGKLVEGQTVVVQQVNTCQYLPTAFFKQARTKHLALRDSADIELFMALGHPAELRRGGRALERKAAILFDQPLSRVQQVQPEECAWGLQYVYPLRYDTDLLPDVLAIWISREQPLLLGKQIMIRSFLFRDLSGRRIISALPDPESGEWFALLEGGVKLYFREELPYFRQRLAKPTIPFFTIGAVDEIILNPAYAYGTMYTPMELCSEWHTAFIYALATDRRTWTPECLQPVYEAFLSFLRRRVCDTDVQTPQILAKEDFLRVLLKNVENVQTYLRGESEVVVSKDLLLLMNSRYIYLPEIRRILKRTGPPVSPEPASVFCQETLCAYLDRARIGSAYERGARFEVASAYFATALKGFRIAGRRVKTAFQEIDLCLVNVSLDQDCWDMGAFILVECKNWKKPAGISVVRELGLAARMRGNKTTLLISKNGWTADAEQEAIRQALQEIFLLCVTEKELRQVPDAAACSRLLREKFRALRAATENSVDLLG